jgi:hypothetical protein
MCGSSHEAALYAMHGSHNEAARGYALASSIVPLWTRLSGGLANGRAFTNAASTLPDARMLAAKASYQAISVRA